MSARPCFCIRFNFLAVCRQTLLPSEPFSTAVHERRNQSVCRRGARSWNPIHRPLLWQCLLLHPGNCRGLWKAAAILPVFSRSAPRSCGGKLRRKAATRQETWHSHVWMGSLREKESAFAHCYGTGQFFTIFRLAVLDSVFEVSNKQH